MATTIHVTGVFQQKFPLTNDGKKSVADGIRSILKRLGLNLESKIRFDTDEKSVTFVLKEDEAKSKPVLAEIEKMPGVAATIAGSSWELLIGRRAAMLDAVDAS